MTAGLQRKTRTKKHVVCLVCLYCAHDAQNNLPKTTQDAGGKTTVQRMSKVLLIFCGHI